MKLKSESSENEYFDEYCEGALEIDLEYSDISTSDTHDYDEPLDLRIKKNSTTDEPRLSLKENISCEQSGSHQFLSYEGGKGRIISQVELDELLSPHVLWHVSQAIYILIPIPN